MAENKFKRFEIYVNFINEQEKVSIKQFLNYAEQNNIKGITARRDLKELEHLNYIKLDIGIIQLYEHKEYEVTRVEKTESCKSEKLAIAIEANNTINTKTIFVSAGTTTEYFVKTINKNLSFLYTNGFEIIKVANNNIKIKRVICTGGKLRPQSSAFVGPIANKIIESMEFDQAYITATHLNDAEFLCNNHDEEAEFLNKVIKNSKEVYCLMDSSKFVNAGSHKITHVSSVDYLITDENVSEEYIKMLGSNCKLIIAKGVVK